jgi:2-amino-4-hydroxy-6-hydroxymethyldihydropteridine diphosphokinase
MRCFVGMGSNLGDREGLLRFGLAGLRASPGIDLVEVSLIYETEPEGSPAPGRSDQPAYLNAVAEITCRLPARALLERLLAIEREAGRTRGPERAQPRTLDLDLLLFGSLSIEEPDLMIPHPRLAVRPFVLEPMAELAAELRHPALPASIAELAARVRDPQAVRLFSPHRPWP